MEQVASLAAGVESIHQPTKKKPILDKDNSLVSWEMNVKLPNVDWDKGEKDEYCKCLHVGKNDNQDTLEKVQAVV